MIKNRLYKYDRIHSYDFILGVMSDSNPIQLIRDFKSNNLDYNNLFEGLSKWNSMEQLSLHSQEICVILKLQKAINIDTREELDSYA